MSAVEFFIRLIRKEITKGVEAKVLRARTDCIVSAMDLASDIGEFNIDDYLLVAEFLDFKIESILNG